MVRKRNSSLTGFDRNALQKSRVPDLSKRSKIQIANIADYEQFVLKNIEGGTERESPHQIFRSNFPKSTTVLLQLTFPT